MKKCAKCQKFKPLTEFGKDNSRKDKMHCFCKQCRNQKAKAWYEANKEKIKQQREANKEKIKQQREANKEKIKAQRKAWNEKNKDKIAEYNRRYYENKRKKIKEQ